MSLLADLMNSVFDLRYRGAGAPDRKGRTLEELCTDLLGNVGEVSGMALARLILDRYAGLEWEDKRAFFAWLTQAQGIDVAQVRTALDDYEVTPDKASYRAYMAVSEPPRQELARRLNQVPGATGQLVDMRSDLLRMIPQNPEFAMLDLDLRHLFASWFNRGFLVLRPISWESPAEILEKIIAYEAVHAIDSWEDLRGRLAPTDRRCFAFFHPSMPSEPLIFVEVALTRGVPGSVQALLSGTRTELAARDADTAVFYSISNCQSGLAGISFGNSLIKQVVADLSRDLPGLKTYVTLSPIPGLMRWLDSQGLSIDADPVRQRQLAAHYLTLAKRPDGGPVDPVARFHLGNGAQVHAIHAGADTSPNGLAQSGGVMVNYLYDLRQITQNHEGFAATGKIAASSEVRNLAAAIVPQNT
ncbi:malonyl-CoA decarboxylase [Puniceibacterium sp. IMCC21224]|uniref:malonyl-CoA decarboxylase n=1 Tax=Puniceibacterium sp. IMCC21224 TaxID=1618204 RepID=UPI00064DB59A|nr:malonyl-CoA decarboxylase [Puniceibacterium sp. IMCC21224]KMK66180.1 Malonyl-CoA decarboxylase (MCD) [Puniceibacterium sp. IMCC21224]